MAQRILDAGYELHVWNRSADKAAALVAAGARLAPTAAALAQRVELLCVCVTDDKAIEALLFGEQGVVAGIAAGAASGLIVADHSTVHPLATRRIAERALREGHIAWVDAPVSGGPTGARQGTLAVFAGGSAADVERARPVLMSFAGKLTHLGPVGSGQIAKACNQMISFGTCAVMAESLHLAARLGLDVAKLPAAIEGGLADSAVLRHYAPQMLGGQLIGNSLNALKDLEIALELGRESVTTMPMTSVLASLHRLVVAQGHHALGMAGPLRLYTQEPLVDVATHAAGTERTSR
jgi:3-hydroxyisobutyrate dehydrogenase-like beta-hydroxyacid dehydrogenase